MLKTPLSPNNHTARHGALSWLATIALVVGLSGCATVAPPSQLPELLLRHDTALPAAKGAPLIASLPSRAWWEDLKDPALNQLLSEAQVRNLGIKASLATVREARAMAGLALAEGRPQGGLALSAQASRPSSPEVDPYRQSLPRAPEQRLISIGQSLSWELDLFGRVGTAQAVAERELEAAQADLHGAQALLQAEVVRNYIQLRAAQQMEELSGQRVALASAKLKHLDARAAAGFVDAREVRIAETELGLRHANLATAMGQVQQALATLALLTGHSPAALDGSLAEMRQPKSLPIVPEQATLIVSEELLKRLPHVARADAALRSSLGHEVLAQRAHWPRISLAATLGLNESTGRLGRIGALRYAAGPSLQWDWLDVGRRTTREAAARAGSERAWAQFEQTVLQALADGEIALRGWQAQYQGWQHSQQAMEATQQAAHYAAKRQALGLEPPINVISSEAQHLDATQAVVLQHAQALLAYVQVQLALGTWQPLEIDLKLL